MGWTVQNYYDRVKALARYEEPSSADILVWINECSGLLQPYAKVEGSSYITLQTDVKEYALPTGFYEAVFVYRQDTADAAPEEIQPLEDWDRHSKGYRLFVDKIIIQPTPTAADNGKKVYVDFHKLIGKSPDGGDLSGNSDTFNIPEYFQDIPFLHACKRAKQQDAEFGEGRDFAAELAARLDEFKRFQNNKRRRKARVVRTVRDWI